MWLVSLLLECSSVGTDGWGTRQIHSRFIACHQGRTQPVPGLAALNVLLTFLSLCVPYHFLFLSAFPCSTIHSFATQRSHDSGSHVNLSVRTIDSRLSQEICHGRTGFKQWKRHVSLKFVWIRSKINSRSTLNSLVFGFGVIVKKSACSLF